MNTTRRTLGPELLDERPLIGITVHLLALPTWGLAAGLVYLVADHEYTRANARNALNWHLTVLAVTALALLTMVLGDGETTIDGTPVEFSPVPPPLDTVFGGIGVVLVVLAVAMWTASFVFTAVATGKAIFGTVWSYPAAYEFIAPGDGPTLSATSEASGVPNRRRVLVAYAVLVPVVGVYSSWTILWATGDAWFWPMVLGVLGLMALSLVTLVALAADAAAEQRTATAWAPRRWLYAGAPPAAGVAVWQIARYAGSMNPEGDAVYGFMIALWAAVVVYLVQRSRHAGEPSNSCW